jgi:hypothetical protein
MTYFSKEDIEDSKTFLDISYIKYHKTLILLQEGHLEQSYELLSELSAKELESETNYYRGLIKLKQMNQNLGLSNADKNKEIETILMHFNKAISSFTSKEYLIKSYFHILLILIFEKKDYYGAQYEVNRFRKLVPVKLDPSKNKDEDEVSFSRISRIFEDDEGH